MLPHLCCDAVLEKLKLPLLGLPKIDGVRLMNTIGKATGRSLEPFANLYTSERFSKPVYAGMDGEATLGDIRGNSLCRDTTGAMNRIKEEPAIVWNAFDLLRETTIKMPYIDRHASLMAYVDHHKPEGVVVVQYEILRTVAEVTGMYERCLDEGYEGLILRDPLGKFKAGRATAREGAYMRMKPASDKDAIVVRLVEALENQNEAKTNALGRTERSTHQENMVGKGMVGMIVARDVKSGKEFNCGAGKMPHADRIHYWLHPEEIIGQAMKYRSMDSGVKNEPRFARFLCLRSKQDMS